MMENEVSTITRECRIRNAVSIVNSFSDHVDYVKKILNENKHNDENTESIILDTKEQYEDERVETVFSSNNRKDPQMLFYDGIRIFAVADIVAINRIGRGTGEIKHRLTLKNLREVNKTSLIEVAILAFRTENDGREIFLKDVIDKRSRIYITWPNY